MLFHLPVQSNIQDQIILQWRSGESATMHILVVHAIVIILTYDPLPGRQNTFIP